ncbi:MAG: AAA family ATPase [Paraprevotella sp.]|nr:AAA family ATPase [Paraprevotella sp.]
MQTIYQTYHRLIERSNYPHRRYLYDTINWQERLIGIKGARGVGKTTLMLQHIHDNFPDRKKALYVSLDQLWFSEHSIMELAEYHYTHGGTHLFLDEVHRYPNWIRELKNIYDSYPELSVVFTGSSLLELDSSVADLSRRCRMYEMKGLSFREFLEFENAAHLQPMSLPDILANHEQIASSLTAHTKVLPLFETYLSQGYYPFYKETDAAGFRERLERIVMTILENDIPAIERIEYETILKTKRLMVILAEMVPFTLNVSTMCSTLGMSRNQLMRLLSLLERSALIRQLFTEAKGLKQLVKPEKILFENPNLMNALSPQAETGTLRETFFASMLSHTHTLQAPKEGDFLVNGNHLFEIGGKGKGFKQIRNIENSFVAADEIEIGFANKIPLWLFGLLY